MNHEACVVCLGRHMTFIVIVRLSDYPAACLLFLCLAHFTANATVTRRGWNTQGPGIFAG